MTSIDEFVDLFVEFCLMGGYAAFVWPAYLITAVVLVGTLMLSITGLRRQIRTRTILPTGHPD